MCDQEGQNFGWLIEVLRMYLSTIDRPLELFYSPKFLVHFSRVVVREPVVMIYHLYMLFFDIRVFLHFFHTARVFPQEVDCHLVALDTETGLRYHGFGIVYSTLQFDGYHCLPFSGISRIWKSHQMRKTEGVRG